MDLFEPFPDLYALRAPLLAFAALGAIRRPLFGRSHLIIEEEINLLIRKNMEVIIQPEVMGNIHPLGTGQTVGTRRAVNGKHFFVRFRHLIDQSQLSGGKGIGAAFFCDS